MADIYEIRLCENKNCGLRYPLTKNHPFGERCPACLGQTHAVLTRSLITEPGSSFVRSPLQLEAILDNVRSAWNVGAIFRTADGFDIHSIYLCGITPTPLNPSVSKTALGASETIPWKYSKNAVQTAREIKSSGSLLWALEQDQRAVPISSLPEWDGQPITIVVGNEVTGVDPELLDLCDRIVYIPMLGKKRSLNVEVAFGVAVSAIRHSVTLRSKF